MKLNISQLLITGVIFLSVFLLGNASFPPAAHTGAPGEGLCSDCHLGNNPLGLDGDIIISGIPTNPIDGERYELEVILRNPNGLAARGGFQLVVLDGDNNNLGSLENSSASSRTRNFAGKLYFEHSPASNFPGDNELIWTVDWLVPEDPENREVIIYAAGNIADGDGSSANDFIVTNVLEATIEMPSSIADLQRESLELYPNPTTDRLYVKGLTQGDKFDVKVFDMMGRRVHNGKISAGQPLSVSQLESGTYLINISDGKNAVSGKFIKQ
ncbi:MAG: T9SS C-terminal target domain-containing protein [Saprospirales bacterium]|nr:MAG: T9SS C-terminal target domain-containing protein [Saprospirales bacterium]